MDPDVLKKARKKAEEIVSRMTVEEKASQLLYESPAIERLGINEYNWWNEACHGVARAGVATVFPQSIALAACFDPALIGRIGRAVALEARAKYNKNVEFGDRGIYKGLTFWAPNINIFRDPRWGRGQETCGEDPFLTSLTASEYIRGLQGDAEFYTATACAKHFAGHSGPEKLRHRFDARISAKDMEETYLPAFYKAVKAGVAGVMGAYNRTNGEPCCASPTLIGKLRGEWGFEGYFVSDCGAISDIYEGHHYTDSRAGAAAAALRAGCDLNCGDAYLALLDAYESDLISEDDLTRAAVSLYTIRVLLGEFEDIRPYSDVPYGVVSCEEHKRLNLTAARESLVLLENRDGFLPVDKTKKRRVAVVGPNATSVVALEGNYNGHADEYVTVAEGVRRVFTDSEIVVADGSSVYQDERKRWDGFCDLASEGAAAAAGADLTILCLGLDRDVEGEDLGYENDFTDYGDRKTLYLPDCQMKLIDAVLDVCEDVVIVVMCGSCADIGEEAREKAKAVIHAWYPGALGGLAVAEAIAGVFSPSGRLPITFYRADEKLPPMEDYSMKGRTYRFFGGKPLYPFGYGLSYTRFEYSEPRIVAEDDEKITLSVEINNAGDFDSLEKAQCYAEYGDSRAETPRLQLCAVEPVFIKAGETRTIDLTIDKYWIKAVLDDGTRVDPDGGVKYHVGGGQPVG